MLIPAQTFLGPMMAVEKRGSRDEGTNFQCRLQLQEVAWYDRSSSSLRLVVTLSPTAKTSPRAA